MALEWLRSAADDLKLISSVIENAALTHMVAFHCQQSIEKSLKAALEYGGRDVPKKHDLLTLKDMLTVCVEIDNEDILELLNSLYIDARYPGSLGLLPDGKPTVAEANEFYQFAQTVYSDVMKLVTNNKC